VLKTQDTNTAVCKDEIKEDVTVNEAALCDECASRDDCVWEEGEDEDDEKEA